MLSLARRAFAWLYPRTSDVEADDALLDAIGGRDDYSVHDDAAEVLGRLRSEVDSRPAPVLVSTEDAMVELIRARFAGGVQFLDARGVWIDAELVSVPTPTMIEIRPAGTRGTLLEFVSDVRPVGSER
jgi:hypothetical protein